MISELRLYDRSRVTTDWTCPRKRYLNYEYEGKGLVSGHTSIELFMGTTIHDGLAGIANGVDIEDIAVAAQKQMFTSLMENMGGEDQVEALNFANEQAALVEGLLRGFYIHVWPSLMSQYPNIVLVEGELMHEHQGLGFMAKPDLVLGDADGNLFYVEYKSTSTKKEGWINSWNTAVQLHSTIKAIEDQLKEKVTGVIVQGLYKGYESYGKQNSPMCYGYRRYGNPPFSQTETIYEYRAGFKRTPTWEMDGGVKAWVEGMPGNVLGDQFPQTPPIFIKDDMIDRFFKQREWREKEIEMAVQMIAEADEESKNGILDVAFPQRFDQCNPYFGRSCAYQKICFGDITDPLIAGFEYRSCHHKPEEEQWVQKGLLVDQK